ncbi:MAG: sugar phosphate nucleotidyltransferase [Candidatus Humimicrobiaceae bacterium]|jgi:glucose-1-phosphate thymidylyltransferase|nr:sugar phosphate nucleotidyltransferase [Actinomycetota bacterium]MDD5600382.1 sugar phosphate nucleotidyltransferase [Actinomycetota bacterium]MDY0028229.1 sugar phosphate nucleotidyltransferase [Candidatus Humimicrobiaceae bacterium]
MKGVILAGGLGKRLMPCTKVTNKHLLPVYNKPMIYYPLKTLVSAGLEDIMIVTGGSHAGDFLRLLGNGSEFGLKDISYTYQEGEGGIADALRLAENFIDNDKLVVMLGDNIIEDDITDAVKEFERQKEGAKIFLKEVSDPERFGVAELRDGKVINIEEKPAKPKSNYAVTGLYMYNSDVFEIIDTLKPSDRGELEITDVNNQYIARGVMTYSILKGWWSDAGTFESLFKASSLVREKLKRDDNLSF